MNCEFCGSPIADGATECPACGAAVAASGAPVEKPAEKPVTKGVVCKQCGKVNPPGSSICVACGSSLQSVFICPKCKSRFHESVQFCPRCGGNVEERSDASKVTRTKFLTLSFLLGWTGAPFFAIGRKKTGVLTLLLFIAVYVCGFIPLFCGNTDLVIISLMALVWIGTIVYSFFVKEDAYGKKIL